MKFKHRNPLSILKSTIQLLDLVAVLCAGYIAHYLKFKTFLLPIEYAVIIFIGAFIYLIASNQLYRSWRGGGVLSVYKRMLISWIIVVNIIFTGLVVTKTATDFSRGWFFYWSFLSVIQFSLYRYIIFEILAYSSKSGFNHKNILIVGRGKIQQEVVSRNQASNWTGFKML